MTKSILFFILLLLISSLSFSQTDSLDTIFLMDKTNQKGKVLKIKEDVVEFLESSSSIIYEYNKNKIDFINLANGRTIRFNVVATDSTVPPKGSLLNHKDEIGDMWVVGVGFLNAPLIDDFKAGYGANLFLELRPPSLISFRADLGYYSADLIRENLLKAKTTFYSTELSLLIMPQMGKLKLYGGFGLGYYFFDNIIDQETVNDNWMNGYVVNESFKSGIGFLIRDGFNLIFSKHLGLYVDIKYMIFNTKVIIKSFPFNAPAQKMTEEDSINLNNFNLAIGLILILY